MRLLTCEPGTEVAGEVLQSLIHNLLSYNTRPLIEKYGLDDIKEGEWYPLENFLSLMNEMAQEKSLGLNFVAIGISIAEYAIMPPEMENAPFGTFIEVWPEHYQVNHRNGDIGQKIVEKISESHYKVTLDRCVYFDDMEYGVLYGFARRFLPAGTHFMVRYDEDTLNMDQGGDKTILHITWE